MIFSNVEDLLLCNTAILSDLEDRQLEGANFVSGVGDIFLTHVSLPSTTNSTVHHLTVSHPAARLKTSSAIKRIAVINQPLASSCRRSGTRIKCLLRS